MNMQQSVFLFGLPEVDTKMIAHEIIIRSDAKENIRTALEKMGISDKTLFSDLLGFLREIHTHIPTIRRLLSLTMEEPRDEKQTNQHRETL